MAWPLAVEGALIHPHSPGRETPPPGAHCSYSRPSSCPSPLPEPHHESPDTAGNLPSPGAVPRPAHGLSCRHKTT